VTDASRARSAIVTGGGRGIGWEIGSLLAREGWRVVACDIEPGLTATRDAGVGFREMDVRDAEQVAATVSALAGELGGLDLLVNNAGVQRAGPTELLPTADWSYVVDVNLHGTFNCLQAAGRAMLDGDGGAIVNIVSVAAERGAAGRAAYGATKAAVIALTRATAVEWAGRGVRVNAVGPGYVDAGVLRQALAEGTLDPNTILARIPLGRFAQPEEIAAMVAYLASPVAAYITGQVFYVDGGFLADYGIPPQRPR
jgi:3-oxoacyl-[acyl-carrier protein] reductase